MIDYFRLCLALLSPWLCGYWICKVVLPRKVSLGFRLGAGYFIGFGLTILLFWSLGVITGVLHFLPVVAILIAVATAAAYLDRRYREPKPFTQWQINWSVVAVVTTCALLVVPVIVDVWLRPLFPWDAWYSYSLRAKVYSHFQELVAFIPQREWRNTNNPEAFNTNIRHGEFIALIQTWVAVGFGRWSESLVNLPWPGAWLALGLLSGGAAREQGYTMLPATLAGSAIIFLPLAGVHAVLAGYAELWVAGYAVLFSGALMAILNYQSLYRWGFIAFLATPGIIVSKQYGIILFLILLGAFFLSLFCSRVKYLLLAFVLFFSVALGWYLALGAPFDLALKTELTGPIGFHNGALHIPGIPKIDISGGSGSSAILVSALFGSRNFLLMSWLTLGLTVLAAVKFSASAKARFVTYWVLFIGFASWLAFSFTSASSYLDVATVHSRFLLVLLLIGFALSVCGQTADSDCSVQSR